MNTPPFVPLRSLALWFVAALLLPYAGIALTDFDDIEDIAVPWALIFFYVGPVAAALHAWVVARLDRRLVGPSRSRAWALFEGMGVAGTAVFLPVVLHGLLLLGAGVALGRWRHVERSLLAVPFAAGLLLAVAALWWARHQRRARKALPHDLGTIGDVVPTAWLWIGWLMATTGFAGVATAAAAWDASTGTGILMLAAWVVFTAVASAGIATRVGQLSGARVPHPHALGREAAGATAVGLLLPIFLMGLLPGWRDAPDIRWAALGITLVAVPLAVWTQAAGRVTRWARWT